MSILQMALLGIVLFVFLIALIVWIISKVLFDRAIVVDDEPELENAFREIMKYDQKEKDRFLDAIELGEFKSGHSSNQST